MVLSHVSGAGHLKLMSVTSRLTHISHDADMSFHCRRREVDTKEPPGAEAPGAVGLHGPFQNKQRSPGGYQLARTVSSPFFLQHLYPLVPLPSPPSCQLSHQTTRHMFRKPPAALRRLLWQQSPVKAWTGPCTFLSYAHQHTYNHIRAVCVFSHHSWTHCSFSQTHAHEQFAHKFAQPTDLLSQLIKEDCLGYSKHSCDKCRSTLIYYS